MIAPAKSENSFRAITGTASRNRNGFVFSFCSQTREAKRKSGRRQDRLRRVVSWARKISLYFL